MSLQNFLQQKKTTVFEVTPVSGGLTDFLKQKKTTSPFGSVPVSGSLSDFLKKGGTTQFPKTQMIPFEKKEEGSKIKDTFKWIGKQLSKPMGVVAKETRGVGEMLGHYLSIASPRISASEGIKAAAQANIEAQKGALRVLVGKEETSWSKEFKASAKEAGQDLTTLDKAMGIGEDFVLDPLWIIKPIKIAKKVGEVTHLGKPIETLASTIRKAPIAKKLKMLFSNTTGNKEFDTIVKKFRNLKNYREANLIDDAVTLQKNIKKLGKGSEEVITEGLENPASMVKITDTKILDIIKNLKTTYKDLLEQSRKVGLTVGEIQDYAPHIRTKASFANTLKKEFGIGAKFFGKGSVEKGRKLEGTIKKLTEKGIDIFEKSPAIQLVKKGQTYAKAITSAEFANSVKKFAIKDGVAVTNPMLKDLKFAPEQAKVIDNFYQGIKPEELKVIVKSFDKVQNWWKAQALISPSYHIRNFAGNLWNNFLAGVTPEKYFQAGMLQKRGIKAPIIDEMKKLGVIDEGWYAKDIGEEVIKRVEKTGNWKSGINPLNQENFAFQLNKKIGSFVENNARIAHYLSMKAKGMSPEKAAESVKKYLFDYGDLTNFEQNVLKRAAPFYTWTSKNLPLQLEGLITQPAKYALPHKIVSLIESGIEVPNEKYMSEYITENIPVRIRKNKEGNTEYFLLGNWLPYASAIDILSHPIDTIIQMATPFGKTPIELWANKSSFWKNTLGEYQDIERRYKQQGEFIGKSMRKKNITLLRNIRILNDVNKWINKQDPTAVQNSVWVKTLNTLFGKTATYDVNKSKFFYDMDTDDRISEFKKAIKDAEKRGYKNKANELC